jgi:hypothetical protein
MKSLVARQYETWNTLAVEANISINQPRDKRPLRMRSGAGFYLPVSRA